MLTVQQAAKRWSKTPRTIERWIAAGLPVTHHGEQRWRLIDPTDLDAFAERMAVRNPSSPPTDEERALRTGRRLAEKHHPA